MVLHVAILAVLARLVTPEEFGLVTVAMVVVGLSTVLAESGIGQAIIQRRTLEPVHLRVGLTLSVLFAMSLWALVVASSALIEQAFAIEGVAPIVTVVSFTFVIRAMSLGDYVLFREMKFRQVTIVELVGYGLGYGLVAITLAIMGAGAWSLALGQVSFSVVRTVLLWFVAPHPARPCLRRDVAADLLSYGGGFTLGRLANWLGREGDNFVVGRFLGVAALGLYGRAYQLMSMPAKVFGQVADRVLFPSMAKIQDQPDRLGKAYLRGMGVLAGLTLPVSALMAVVADEVILVLLGEDWLGLRAAFNVLVFGIMFRTSYKLSEALARAAGAVYRQAWRGGVYAAAILLGALVGQMWGLTGVAVGVTVGIVVNFLLMAQLGIRLTGVTWLQFAQAHLPGILAGAVTVAVSLPIATMVRALQAPAALVVATAGLGAVLSMLLLLRIVVTRVIALESLVQDVRNALGPRSTGLLDRLFPKLQSQLD